MSLPITSSQSIIKTEASGSLAGSIKYVLIGGSTIRRKFDRSVIPSLWKELWVGLMWGLQPNYIFQSPDNLTVCNETAGFNGGFSIGLNHSSGSIPNDRISGSVWNASSSFCSHSIYIGSDLSSPPLTHYSCSSGNTYIGFGPFMCKMENNNQTSLGGNTTQLLFENPGEWKFFLMRLSRDVVSPQCTMSVQYAGYNIDAEEINETPLTGSSALAEALNRSSLSDANKILTFNDSAGSTISTPVDELSYGELDEVFISWSPYTYPLRIGAVALKMIPS